MIEVVAMHVQLVRVTTDDRTHRVWAAATSREEAVERVLDAIPEGWTARLLGGSLKVREDGLSNDLLPGEVRELKGRWLS
jgi:hypothetical protein